MPTINQINNIICGKKNEFTNWEWTRMAKIDENEASFR